VQRGARWRELGQAAFDGGVNVLVGGAEFEVATVELPPNSAQAALDRRALRLRDDARSGEPAGMGDAARDVERVELVIRLQ
jgi:hypothetical protein